MVKGVRTHLTRGFTLPFKKPKTILILCVDAELMILLTVSCIILSMYVMGTLIGPISLEKPFTTVKKLLGGVAAGGGVVTALVATIILLHSFMVNKFYSCLAGVNGCNLAKMFKLQLILAATLVTPFLAIAGALMLGWETGLPFLAFLAILAVLFNLFLSFSEVELVVNNGGLLKGVARLLSKRGGKVLAVYALVKVFFLAVYLLVSYPVALVLRGYGLVGFLVYLVLFSAFGGLTEALCLSVKYTLYSGCLSCLSPKNPA